MSDGSKKNLHAPADNFGKGTSDQSTQVFHQDVIDPLLDYLINPSRVAEGFMNEQFLNLQGSVSEDLVVFDLNS